MPKREIEALKNTADWQLVWSESAQAWRLSCVVICKDGTYTEHRTLDMGLVVDEHLGRAGLDAISEMMSSLLW